MKISVGLFVAILVVSVGLWGQKASAFDFNDGKVVKEGKIKKELTATEQIMTQTGQAHGLDVAGEYKKICVDGYVYLWVKMKEYEYPTIVQVRENSSSGSEMATCY